MKDRVLNRPTMGNVYYRDPETKELHWYDWCSYMSFMSDWIYQYGDRFIWVTE